MKSKYKHEQFLTIKNEIAQLQYLADLLKQHQHALVGDFSLCSLKHAQENIFNHSENFITLEDDQNSSYTVSIEDIEQINEQNQMDHLDIVSFLQAPLESLLHAVLPYTFVQNSSIGSIQTLMHLEDEKEIISAVFGDTVLVLPYMPMQFELVQAFIKKTKGTNLETIDAIVLKDNTVITFGNDVQSCYEKIVLVENKATNYLIQNGAVVCGDEVEKINKSLLDSIGNIFEKASNCIIDVYKTKNKDIPLQTNLEVFAYMRKKLSDYSGVALLANFDNSKKAIHFSNFDKLEELANKAPLNAYSVQMLGSNAMIVNEDTTASLEEYLENNEELTPSWAVWENFGTIAFAPSIGTLYKTKTVVSNTLSALLKCDALGGYHSFASEQILQIENESVVIEDEVETYGGKIALVRHSNSALGAKIIQELSNLGAVVVEVDDQNLEKVVNETVKNYGGIDIVVSNPMASNSDKKPTLDQYMKNNFLQHKELLDEVLPFLKLGIDPTFIYLSSVQNQDTGYLAANAALEAYATAKAAKLEEYGIRINCVSSNETQSSNDEDVANIVTLLCSNDFAHSTGTTIIVDAARNHQF
ncbi:MAG: SDR family oxidoreductase [Campylobacterota bacterium]|nr:SDR family oxidoreductase [Campylobacterota bacterium]